ncbi:MAG: DNA (cytosine-5-)-methyltransferase [Thermoprotei archaeon]|nr:MAG: DNA (cytosine-5-)-methyltransferase [Thermoprotei archaeon]
MYTVADLFCGAGGFSRGFKDEGFKIVLGIDNFDVVADTFKRNFPEAKVIVDDIKNVHSKDVIELIEEVDVIIGGPPCEAFTKANPRRKERPIDRLYTDPTGSLVLHFIRIVGDLKPKIFVMENVPAIAEGELRHSLVREFKRACYDRVYFNVLRAEKYGNPSHRTRVFMSNIKLSPEPAEKTVRVIDAIGDLPSPYSVHEIPNHEPIPLSRRKMRRISKLRWGEALIRYRGSGGKIYTNLVRLHPYKIAPTVMGSSRFVHPFENRLLTVREQARLMGFPDDHIFIGGRDVQFDEVGEAVPVPLARAIARVIKEELSSM